jgi:hypothetical protein
MTPRPLPLAAALLTLAALPLSLALRPPPARADAAPAASPALSGGAPAASAAMSGGAPAASSAPASAAPPTFADDPPGEEKSKPPTPAEWKESARVSFDRPLPEKCEARRVREWVRLTCGKPAASVTLVGGSADFTASISPYEFGDETRGSYNIQFPVRRGEHRILEVAGVFDTTYSGPTRGLAHYVVSSWPAGDAPALLIQP